VEKVSYKQGFTTAEKQQRTEAMLQALVAFYFTCFMSHYLVTAAYVNS